MSECLFVVCVRSRGGEVDGCARGCYCFFSVLASAAALFDVGNYIGIIILSLFTSSSLLLLCLDVVITIVVAVFMCHCQCICIIAVAFIFMTIFILFDL